jgi:Leucine-rich repeat (LRR) protein
VDTTSSDGLVYYTNLATRITQWDMPPEMDTFDALENLTELNVAHNRLTEIASVKLLCARVAVTWCPKLRCVAVFP